MNPLHAFVTLAATAAEFISYDDATKVADQVNGLGIRCTVLPVQINPDTVYEVGNKETGERRRILTIYCLKLLTDEAVKAATECFDDLVSFEG